MQQMIPLPYHSSSLVFMLQKKALPSLQQLKILTQLQPNISKDVRPQENDRLARISVYTQNFALQGQILGKNIARQLEWNVESFNMLVESLMGKRVGVEVKFNPIGEVKEQDIQVIKQEKKEEKKMKYLSNYSNVSSSASEVSTMSTNIKKSNNGKNGQSGYILLKPIPHNFQLVTQISSGINLILFSIELQVPYTSHPFQHMLQKFSEINKKFLERDLSYKALEQQKKKELNESDAIERQIIDSASIEANVMKKNFLQIINSCKGEIKKYVGGGVINPKSGLVQNWNNNINIAKNLNGNAKNDDNDDKQDGELKNKDNKEKKKGKINEKPDLIELENQKESRKNSFQQEQQFQPLPLVINKKQPKPSRIIAKVDRQFYSQQPQHEKLQIQQPDSHYRQQQQKQQKIKNHLEQLQKRSKQHKKQEMMKKKDRMRVDSSDDDMDSQEEEQNMGNKLRQSEGKTYLEMQREKMMRNAEKNNDENQNEQHQANWDQLFN